MDFVQKLIDGIGQAFSNITSGFSNMFQNFGLSNMFGGGSAPAQGGSPVGMSQPQAAAPPTAYQGFIPNPGPTSFAGPPLRQETPERAAFNPTNPYSVQNQVVSALGGAFIGRFGNTAFAPVAESLVTATKYGLGGPPPIAGHFSAAAAPNNGRDPALGRQQAMQGIIQDGIQTMIGNAATKAIGQHSHPGGAFGAFLGKLGR